MIGGLFFSFSRKGKHGGKNRKKHGQAQRKAPEEKSTDRQEKKHGQAQRKARTGKGKARTGITL